MYTRRISLFHSLESGFHRRKYAPWNATNVVRKKGVYAFESIFPQKKWVSIISAFWCPPLRVCESATPSLKQKSAVFHFLFLIVLACFVHLPSFRSVRSSAHENRGEGVTKKDNKKKHRKVFFLLFQPETLSFTYYLFPPFLFLLEDNSTHSTNIRFNTFLPSLIRVHACASNIQAKRERESFIVKCLVSKEDPFGKKGRENYKGSELRPCVNSHQFAFARSGPRQIRTNQQLLLRTLLHTLSLFLSFSHTLSLSHSHAQTTTNSNRKRKRERQQWYLWSTALSLSLSLTHFVRWALFCCTHARKSLSFAVFAKPRDLFNTSAGWPLPRGAEETFDQKQMHNNYRRRSDRALTDKKNEKQKWKWKSFIYSKQNDPSAYTGLADLTVLDSTRSLKVKNRFSKK